MTHRALLWASVLVLSAACQVDGPAPDSGTFVGNPSLTPTMTARLADNDVQHADRGVLEAFEVFLTDCEQTVSDIPLGGRTLIFEGAESTDIIELEPQERCGLWLVVFQFEVTWDEDGVLTTVVADNFDLAVAPGFTAEEGGRYRLRLGDEAWLADVAALAPQGQTTILNGTDPALDDAFYEGLVRGSDVEVLGN
jgi:hypothetical protein